MLDLFIHVKTAYELKNIINTINKSDDSIDTPIDYDTFVKLLSDPYFQELGLDILPGQAHQLFNQIGLGDEVIDVLEFTTYVAKKRMEKLNDNRSEIARKEREEREDALGK